MAAKKAVSEIVHVY